MTNSFWLSCGDGWRFRPDASLLGMAMRRDADSAWQAGSRFIYASVLGGAIVLILAGMMDSVRGSTVAAASLIAAYVAFCLIGFAPSTRITGEVERIALTQGRRSISVPLAAIRRVRLVSAETFHGAEQKHLHLEIFGGRSSSSVLLLDTSAGCLIAVMLPEPELRRAAAAIEQRLASTRLANALPELIVHE